MQNMQNHLIEDFTDAEYAHAYMGSHTVSTIAAQVYWTRKRRNWTQDDLAGRSGIAQARISKIEAGDFTSLTMSTLHKLANALDVNLRVELEPFSHAVHSVCHQTRADLELTDRVSSLREMKNSLFVTAELFGGKPVQVTMLQMTTTPPVQSTRSNSGAASATAVTIPMGTPFNLPQPGVPA